MLSGKSALVSGASKGVGEQVAGRPKGWLPQHCVGTAAARLKPLLLRRWTHRHTHARTHRRTAAPSRRLPSVPAGQAIAVALAQEGAVVHLTARNEGALLATAEQCRRSGAAGVAVHPCDLTNPQEASGAWQAQCRGGRGSRSDLGCGSADSPAPPLLCGAGGCAVRPPAGPARLHRCAGQLRGGIPRSGAVGACSACCCACCAAVLRLLCCACCACPSACLPPAPTTLAGSTS